MQKNHSRQKSRVPPLFTLAFLLLATQLVSGCQPSVPAPAKLLIGTWVLSQPERLADRINQANAGLPRPEAESDEPVPSSGGSKMMLEFRADGTLRTMTDMGQLQQEKQGTWSFASDSNGGKKLAIRCLLNQQTSEVEVEFIEPELISLVPPNMAGLNTKLTFRRTQ
jgi:hypothetical protein